MNSCETRCLNFLQSYFPNEKWEIKYKHPDIRNPITDRALELDLYCINLKLAIEYNGPQHYLPHFYNGYGEKLPAQMNRDFTKSKRCVELGITLIDVPNLSDEEVNIESFLGKHLIHRGFIRQTLIIREEKTTTTVLTTTSSTHNTSVDVRNKMEEKACNKCGITKPLETGFHKNQSDKSGYRSDCKLCRKVKTIEVPKPEANIVKVIPKQEVLELSPEEKLTQCLASLNMDVEQLNEIYSVAIKVIENQRNPPGNTLTMRFRDMIDLKCIRGVIQNWASEIAFADGTTISLENYEIGAKEETEEIIVKLDRGYTGKQLQDLRKRLTRVFDLNLIGK